MNPLVPDFMFCGSPHRCSSDAVHTVLVGVLLGPRIALLALTRDARSVGEARREMSALSELQQSSYASDLSHIASPLNSARSNLSPSAAARRVGISAHGVNIDVAKRNALITLAAREAEEQTQTFSELDQFDERLDTHLSTRPKLGESARRSLPLALPPKTSAELAAAGTARAGRRNSPRKPTQNRIAIAFHQMDKNGDGTLSKSEVIRACRADAELRSLLGMPSRVRPEDTEFFERLFQRMDNDGSKSIDYEEFEAFFSGYASPSHTPKLQRAMSRTEPRLTFGQPPRRGPSKGETM